MVMAGVVVTLPLMYAAVPPALVLPAISALLLLTGFGVAAFASWAGRAPDAERLGPRDVAGALVLLGFAAALLSDAEVALATFAQWQSGFMAAGPM